MERKKSFSLIELLMILMLVGIVITFIIPMRNNLTYQNRIKEAATNMQILARATNRAFTDTLATDPRKEIDWQQLSSDYSEVINEPLKAEFFEYTATDSIITATSTKAFGKEGLIINYAMPKGPFSIGEDTKSKDTLDRNWLP